MTDVKLDTLSMSDLQKTIEEIIEQRITDARKEVEQLRDENVTLNLELAELQKRVEALDRNSKRGSLVVRGLKNTPQTTEMFVRLCENQLNVDVDVIDCIKLPSGDHLIKLASVEQAEKVLKRRQNFKGTCYVNRNLTRSERTKNYYIRMLAKKLKSFDTAKVRNGDFSLYVNDKTFTWYDGKLFGYKDEDAKMLNDLFKKCNIDMTCGVFAKPKHTKLKSIKELPSPKSENPCYLN